jgi:oligopeptide/dipeptide ABC transporter ATP-binding protein
MNQPVHPYTLRLFSASPTLHGTLKSSEKVRENEPLPQAANGCPYAGQCDRKDSSCLEKDPELWDIGEGQLVACIHSKRKLARPPA